MKSEYFTKEKIANLSELETKELTEMIFDSKKQRIEVVNADLCQDQQIKCVEAIQQSVGKFYHKGMELEELQRIIQNVGMNRSEKTDVTQSIRLMMV